MKTILLLALLFFVATIGMAQSSTPDSSNGGKVKVDTPKVLRNLKLLKCSEHPLPSVAFDQMIVKDITYAIAGENSPVSGIKIDISKPEGTITGIYSNDWGILKFVSFWGLELKGGVTEKNFSLFKGFGNANSTFELKPSVYIIPAVNIVQYGTDKEAAKKKPFILAKNELALNSARRITDTFLVIHEISKQHLGRLAPDFDYPLARTKPDSIYKKIAIFLVKKILKKDSLQIIADSQTDDIVKIIEPVKRDTSTGDLVADSYLEDVSILYQKYDKLFNNAFEETLTKMISNASNIWTRKIYYWVAVTPFAKTEKVTEYYTKYESKDSSYFKSDYHFYYGLTANFNFYLVNINRFAQLIRYNVSISRSNNLATLSSYNYEARSPLYAYGTKVTETSKTGSYYNHGEFKSDLLSMNSLEYYFLPLKSMVPGFFASINVNRSKLYNLPDVKNRMDDEFLIGGEAGIVFNINNREKDKEKNLLSILLYMRYEDLTDSRRTSIKTNLEESRDDFRKRNISFGVKVGIPINLPQRTE